MIKVRPRVLFVGAFPPPGREIFGGMITSCAALLASTLPARVELSLLDSTQLSNPPPSLPVRSMLAIVRFIRFIGRFEAQRPAAVMLFVAVGASILEKGAMAWYARLRGVRTVMFPRGASIVDDCKTSAFTRAWAKASFRGAAKIVCQGTMWRDFAIEQLGFAAKDVTVMRNWTATRELLEIGAQRVGRPDAPVRLLFVGWLEQDKGVFELLEACRQLVPTHLFTLDFAGEGHASAAARAVVTRYGLNAVVRFRGWLQKKDIRQALSEADVLVLPSWAEGLPNAMVEAMAARVAIVVSRVGAVPDVITHRCSGLLVTPRDVESLRQALADIITDDGLRERLAAAGYSIAARDFGVEAAVDRLMHVLEGGSEDTP